MTTTTRSRAILATASRLFAERGYSQTTTAEIAREAGRQICKQTGVQFLDDTVASTRLQLARDANGRRILRRTYRFEFTETGNTRREGEVVMLGARIESVTMEPYQIMDEGAEL